jgi:hypothetical protein
VDGWFVSPKLLRTIAVVTALFLVQFSLFDSWAISGVHVDCIWTLAAIGGLLGGARFGATFGFSVGLAMDLFLPTPFGLTALVCCLVGAVVGQLADQGLDADLGPVVPGVCAVAAAAAVLCYPLLGVFIGANELMKAPLLLIVAVDTLASICLALPVLQAMRWAGGREGFAPSPKAPSAW